MSTQSVYTLGTEGSTGWWTRDASSLNNEHHKCKDGLGVATTYILFRTTESAYRSRASLDGRRLLLSVYMKQMSVSGSITALTPSWNAPATNKVAPEPNTVVK